MTAASIPQGATVLSLDTQSLLRVIKNAKSVIAPYEEAKGRFVWFTELLKYCESAVKAKGGLVYSAAHYLPDLEDFGWDADELAEYNQRKGILKGATDFDRNGKWQGIARKNLIAFAKNALKNNSIQPDILAAKSEMEIAEKALKANIQYVNLIPSNYRYTVALDEILSYIENLRAENWKEAVNIYEEQLDREGSAVRDAIPQLLEGLWGQS